MGNNYITDCYTFFRNLNNVLNQPIMFNSCKIHLLHWLILKESSVSPILIEMRTFRLENPFWALCCLPQHFSPWFHVPSGHWSLTLHEITRPYSSSAFLPLLYSKLSQFFGIPNSSPNYQLTAGEGRSWEFSMFLAFKTIKNLCDTPLVCFHFHRELIRINNA